MTNPAEKKSLAHGPLVDPKVCPSCFHKSCKSLGRPGSKSILITSSRDVPYHCPLKVKSSREVNKYSMELSKFSVAEIIHMSKVGYPELNDLKFETSSLKVFMRLVSQGEIAILAAPYGSASHKSLKEFSVYKAGAYRRIEEQEFAEKKAKAKAEKPKPALINPTWIWLANPKSSLSEEKEMQGAAPGEAVWCKVDSQGMMAGDSVSFTIFLKGNKSDGNNSADLKLETLSGRVGENRKDYSTVVKWILPPIIHSNPITVDKDRFYFIAKAAAAADVKSSDLSTTPLEVDGIEIADILFDTNAALPMLCDPNKPDEDPFSVLSYYAEALVYGDKHSELAILIYGHTDTSGGENYNMELSHMRAGA